MKLNIRNIMTIAAVAASSLVASAQFNESGYFLDGYTNRFQMNPAMGNEKNFVAMPAMGNIEIGMHGNVGVKNLIYNLDGKTVLFSNPGISVGQALDNLKNRNKIGGDINIGILGAGFKAWGGYNTVTLNTRVNFGASIPKELFSLVKQGIENKSYDISNLKAQAKAFVELGMGHSRQLTSEWRVGGTLKFYFGAGNLDASFREAKLDLGEESWNIQAEADIRANVKGFQYKLDTADLSDGNVREYVNGAKVDGAGLGGFGLGVDLGAVYTPAALPDWEFSAALLDLGFISWSENHLASTNGLKTFESDKHTFNASNDAGNAFEKEWDKIKDDISAMYELEDMGNTGSRTTGAAATLNLGAKYTLPMYKPLSFGLLNTTRMNGSFSWTDFRLSANIAPVKVFSAGMSLAAGTFGLGFGWIADVHVTGFNFFIGMDHTMGKLAKQGVPLTSNAQLNLGMNFLF